MMFKYSALHPRTYRVLHEMRELPGDELPTSYIAVSDAEVFIKSPKDTPPPYDVVNEYVCGELAKLIRLPVPPSFLGRRAGDTLPYFCSPNFNLAGENAPPIDAARAVEEQPDVCTGVLAFDIWIANSDRHDKNLAYRRSGVGRGVHVFDHSHALFRESNSLTMHEGGLGITGADRPHNRHCLLDALQTAEFFPKWIRRVQGVADEYIEEVLREAVSIGLPPLLAEQGASFLKRRRDTLNDLINSHRAEFTGIEQWNLLLSA
jgi:hypothetical protein